MKNIEFNNDFELVNKGYNYIIYQLLQLSKTNSIICVGINLSSYMIISIFNDPKNFNQINYLEYLGQIFFLGYSGPVKIYLDKHINPNEAIIYNNEQEFVKTIRKRKVNKINELYKSTDELQRIKV